MRGEPVHQLVSVTAGTIRVMDVATGKRRTRPTRIATARCGAVTEWLSDLPMPDTFSTWASRMTCDDCDAATAALRARLGMDHG